MPQIAPYGSWKSPITSDLIVSESIGLGQIALDGEDIYWVESRPSEAGRNVLVRKDSRGGITDVTPPPFGVRTRVHEYGGGAFTMSGGVVYFCNFADQRMYRQEAGGEPQAITPEADVRYADMVVDGPRGRIICVQEDHTDASREAVNSIVSLDLGGNGDALVLFSGSDFCSSPRLSPDGSTLAWLSWDHPNMPWDGTQLWTAIFNQDSSMGIPSPVAGGVDESIVQPEWSPDGTLYFVSDRTNWWNLYRWRSGRVEPVCPMDAEFARPQWRLATPTYGFQSAGRIICTYTQGGSWFMGSISITAEGGPWSFTPVDIPYSEMGRGEIAVDSGKAVLVAGSPVEPYSVIKIDLSEGETQVIRRSTGIDVDAGCLSIPQPQEFPTENGLSAHAFYYAPKNEAYTAPAGELPPLLVKSHGGPTGATGASLDLAIQYLTSRGFAVMDVNYGGSTGYGRDYRQRLNGQWGIVDVDDCVNAARYLVERGLADGGRLAIDGGSAGGFTTLAVLTFRDVFHAGASYYGVSDLEALAKDTHKFESRYLDSLIGPYPERRDLYLQRSPINHTDGLSCPLILFQGLEDKIVPPDQAESMYRAVKAKGIATAYLPFEGEQHGFRQAANIKRALDSELYFYSQVFGFTLADPVEPVAIDNI